MLRTRLTRIAAGALGLALLALAATGAARSAHAGGGLVITPNTPTINGPTPSGGGVIIVEPPGGLVDLVVQFEKVSCDPYQEGGVHLLFQVRIINKTNLAANGTWQTDIKLDGVAVAGSPKFTTGPLYASIVYSFNVPNMTPGWHSLSAYTDSTHKVFESNENNNTAATRIYCAAS